MFEYITQDVKSRPQQQQVGDEDENNGLLTDGQWIVTSDEAILIRSRMLFENFVNLNSCDR